IRDPVLLEARREALLLLESVEIPNAYGVLKQYPHELSGGMLQRAMISIALANNPRILLADEPTTALDVTVQAQILRLIKNLQNNLGTSIILITHDLGVIAETCDRVAVMYAGNIVETATTEELFKNPKHPYTIGLLQSIPRVDDPNKVLKSISGNVPNLINPPSGCRFHPRCPFVFDRCKVEKPETLEVSPGHTVACHLFYGRG
ncbi:MAG: ABC transporter ATP-binding protein, partial [Thermoplasmatales archaeon]